MSAVSAIANFVSSATCCKILTGLSASLVFVTLPSPTFTALIPFAILSFVTTPEAIRGLTAVPAKSPVN